MEKECFKCREVKPIVEFYKHPKMPDGYLNKCKECHKTDVKQNYKDKVEQYAEYERERFQRPERKAKAIEYQKQRREKNPEKYKAHSAVSNAIRDKRLFKQPCEVCGAEKVQAHHDDYSKPLEVRWLCRKHHLEVHGKVAYKTVEPVEVCRGICELCCIRGCCDER